MKISEIRKDYEDLTGSASKLNRQCVLAAIAVIWMLRIDEGNRHTIAPEFASSMLWFVVSIMLDILQYFLLGMFWYCYYQYKKCNDNVKWSEELEVKEPECVNNVIFVICWFGKMVASLIGFYYLGKALYLL